MGAVWQARDEILGRDVAVKELIWPAYFTEEEQQAACRRATREAKVAARLSHRNVIRIFDIVAEGGCPWIVMELLSPKSLRDLVKEEGPLSSARAAEVGLGVLAALRAAHAEGIVHRDVKPANILVDGDRVVLTDFGIAQAAGTSVLTTVGALVGSPSYIAPERARGGRAGPAADLWGLGASLYLAVEGYGPFDRHGDALAALTAAVIDEPEPAIHAGPLLWPVISGLLRKDPAERLGTADAERMLRLAADGAASLTAVGPVAGATHRSRRSLVAAAPLAGTVALAVLAISVTAVAFVLTSSPRQETAPAAAISPSAKVGPHLPVAAAHPSTVPAHSGTPAKAPETAHGSSAPSTRHTPATISYTTGGAGYRAFPPDHDRPGPEAGQPPLYAPHQGVGTDPVPKPGGPPGPGPDGPRYGGPGRYGGGHGPGGGGGRGRR
jgi:tRNA A-37 threonylcarbamoyl transferase component Bud32